GWGGWWFWDPSENASFMPWLAGTALIHSLAATEKRSAYKAWTVLLAIMTFALTLLGTFLIRSGTLTSVHAFASDPVRGQFILALLAITIGGSLILYAVQASKVNSQNNYGLFSKEIALLFNNVLLAVCTFVVLIGTLHPLIIDAFTDNKSSVGPPYFNLMFSIFFVPILLLMPIGQQINWKQQEMLPLLKKYWLLLLLSFAVMFALTWLFADSIKPMAVFGAALGLWVMAGCFRYIQLQTSKAKSFTIGLSKISRSYWGMITAHIGVAVTVIGAVLTSYYSIEKDLRIAETETVQVQDFSIYFKRFENLQGPNYIASQAHFVVNEGGNMIAQLRPEKRKYNASQMVMTEAAIDPGFVRDLYIAMGEPLDDGAWAIRLYYKPFVRWIWLGAILMALGGLLAVSDKRYREKLRNKISHKKKLKQQELV
ncbi:MAG: cytochrome c biogenesis protein CcsA, partial [Kangiellaceae bacterium]|nr:cytochrome c biogenesis protein CcsA [Kangiellaceae bacterium]